MRRWTIPDNLRSLHGQEEALRSKALQLVEDDDKLALHLLVIERAMDLADLLRQYPTEDEDMKVVQVLGMRAFNALGASVKLSLSGYGQNSVLIMRDILETVFLLDLFKGDPETIKSWRNTDKRERMKHFSPLRVREALDKRDGFDGKKRAALYELFSELAAHPTMRSAEMMRPERGGDAVIGPFIETGSLKAVISELGRLAIQVGEVLNHFFPKSWAHALPARDEFARTHRLWLKTIYSRT